MPSSTLGNLNPTANQSNPNKGNRERHHTTCGFVKVGLVGKRLLKQMRSFEL
jgi:hypothetical protein